MFPWWILGVRSGAQKRANSGPVWDPNWDQEGDHFGAPPGPRPDPLAGVLVGFEGPGPPGGGEKRGPKRGQKGGQEWVQNGFILGPSRVRFRPSTPTKVMENRGLRGLLGTLEVNAFFEGFEYFY